MSLVGFLFCQMLSNPWPFRSHTFLLIELMVKFDTDRQGSNVDHHGSMEWNDWWTKGMVGTTCSRTQPSQTLVKMRENPTFYNSRTYNKKCAQRPLELTKCCWSTLKVFSCWPVKEELLVNRRVFTDNWHRTASSNPPAILPLQLESAVDINIPTQAQSEESFFFPLCFRRNVVRLLGLHRWMFVLKLKSSNVTFFKGTVY